MKNPLHLAELVLLAVTFGTAAQGAAFTFSNAGITCVNSTTPAACSGDTHNIWNTGDFIQQTFTVPSLTSVSQLGLSLSLFNNLAPGQAETWDITINSTAVGSFTFTGSALTSLNQTFNFSPIAGIGGFAPSVPT